MTLKIRLRQQGRKGQLTYRLVLTDSKKPRDGKYLETLGWYNPHHKTEDADSNINPDRISHWLDHGAVPTEKSMALIKRKAPEVYSAFVKRKLQKLQKRKK